MSFRFNYWKERAKLRCAGRFSVAAFLLFSFQYSVGAFQNAAALCVSVSRTSFYSTENKVAGSLFLSLFFFF